MTRSLPIEDPPQLGPFRLTGRLDETPAGIVYQGIDPHGRQICLAVLNRGAASDAAARDRFRAAILAEPLDRRPPDDAAAIVGAEPESRTPWVATLYEPGAPGAERFLRPVLLQGVRGGRGRASRGRDRQDGHRRVPFFQPHWLGSREPAFRPHRGPLRDLARDRGIAATILMVAALLVLLAVLMLLLFACRPTTQTQQAPSPTLPTPTQVSPSQSATPSPTPSSSGPSPSTSGSVRPSQTEGDGGQGNSGDA
jgi:hypothetical protein